jgi:hypothetical protein
MSNSVLRTTRALESGLVCVSLREQDGGRVFVSNWGVTDYKFANPKYTGSALAGVGTTGQNAPSGYYVPAEATAGPNPKTSSVAVLQLQHGDPGPSPNCRTPYTWKRQSLRAA